MPWWSWLLIWGGLCLALIAMLAVGAWWLFRKLHRVAVDLEELAQSLEVLERVEAVAERQRYAIAAVADLAEVKARRRAARERSLSRRATRRKLRLLKAKLITSADPTKRT